MVTEFFVKLLMRAKETAKALKARFAALSKRFLPKVPVEKFLVPAVSPETGNALTVSKRYRLTSDHSPVFSLFTFFGCRR
jgi:hypothetical protein